MSRAAASECAACVWELLPLCSHGDDGSACAGTDVACPDGERDRVLVRTDPDAPWDDVGDVCVGGGQRPVTVADAAQAVRDRFVDRLPGPDPSSQPANGALTNLPAVFASGQGAGVDADDFPLLAMPVHVEARPSWTWDFGDGTTLSTAAAGGRYPDTDVEHAYARPGRYTASVRTDWSGTFTVDGLGPFDVTGGPVTQRASVAVLVRDAAARLVD